MGFVRPPDDHARPGIDGGDRVTGLQVEIRVVGSVGFRNPERRVVGFVPYLVGVDGQRVQPRMSSPERAARAVAPGERAGPRGEVQGRARRRVILSGNRLRPVRRVVEDRQPLQAMCRERAGDLVVEAPVEVVDAAGRSHLLARLPERVAACHRGPGPLKRRQRRVDLRRRVRAVVEQAVDVDPERFAGRCRLGRRSRGRWGLGSDRRGGGRRRSARRTM